MMDNNSTPIDLCIKRKYDDIDSTKLASKKKSKLHHGHEIPLDLSVKSPSTHRSTNSITNIHPSSMPFYDPTNLLLNSSALLYDLFLANFNAYCQQRPTPIETTPPAPPVPIVKSSKQLPINSSRSIKDNSSNKSELYACSCGEKYGSVAHLVTHLKITNHHAQLSSNHDEVAKLVRGQDIWLSRDTNPANQILKCLRCSLSFETLPDLTAHMMKTNHFTQLMSSSSSTSKALPSNAVSSSSSSSTTNKYFHPSSTTSPTRSTCLICSQQFAREIDLVDHIQHVHQIRFNCTTCGMYFENEHLYKDHMMKEMHHRNGKANRNRDYFLQQCKTLQKRSSFVKSDKIKTRRSSDTEVEQVLNDLVDQIVKQEEKATSNALSLLQNFVIEQTPSTTSPVHADLNNNHCEKDLSDENSLRHLHDKSSAENPLASLEKMLSYPTATVDSLSTTMMGQNTRSTLTNHSMINIKKKKFDKYRLFAEKMLRSTLS